MTETEIKLEDARIQLELAMSRENILDINIVRSCINAFISNARSVTFTMQNEYSSSEVFAKWYATKQTEMKAEPILKFFNEQRVISIHQQSVQPNQRTMKINNIEIDGQFAKTGIGMVYVFDNFSKIVPGDTGNVFRICKQYYDYLLQLVNECLEIKKSSKYCT